MAAGGSSGVLASASDIAASMYDPFYRHVLWDCDTKTACQRCERLFGVTRRRHHCRSCGLVYCDDCTKYNVVLPFTDATPLVLRDLRRPVDAESSRAAAAAAGGQYPGHALAENVSLASLPNNSMLMARGGTPNPSGLLAQGGAPGGNGAVSAHQAAGAMFDSLLGQPVPSNKRHRMCVPCFTAVHRALEEIKRHRPETNSGGRRGGGSKSATNDATALPNPSIANDLVLDELSRGEHEAEALTYCFFRHLSAVHPPTSRLALLTLRALHIAARFDSLGHQDAALAPTTTGGSASPPNQSREGSPGVDTRSRSVSARSSGGASLNSPAGRAFDPSSTLAAGGGRPRYSVSGLAVRASSAAESLSRQDAARTHASLSMVILRRETLGHFYTRMYTLLCDILLSNAAAVRGCHTSADGRVALGVIGTTVRSHGLNAIALQSRTVDTLETVAARAAAMSAAPSSDAAGDSGSDVLPELSCNVPLFTVQLLDKIGCSTASTNSTHSAASSSPDGLSRPGARSSTNTCRIVMALAERVAVRMAARYSEQLACLTTTSLEVLAHMCVGRIVACASRRHVTSLVATLSADEFFIRALLLPLHADFPDIPLQTRVSEADVAWTDTGLLRDSGIRTEDGEYFDGPLTSKYCYRVGSVSEAVGLGFHRAVQRAALDPIAPPEAQLERRRALEGRRQRVMLSYAACRSSDVMHHNHDHPRGSPSAFGSSATSAAAGLGSGAAAVTSLLSHTAYGWLDDTDSTEWELFTVHRSLVSVTSSHHDVAGFLTAGSGSGHYHRGIAGSTGAQSAFERCEEQRIVRLLTVVRDVLTQPRHFISQLVQQYHEATRELQHISRLSTILDARLDDVNDANVAQTRSLFRSGQRPNAAAHLKPAPATRGEIPSNSDLSDDSDVDDDGHELPPDESLFRRFQRIISNHREGLVRFYTHLRLKLTAILLASVLGRASLCTPELLLGSPVPISLLGARRLAEALLLRSKTLLAPITISGTAAVLDAICDLFSRSATERFQKQLPLLSDASITLFAECIIARVLVLLQPATATQTQPLATNASSAQGSAAQSPISTTTEAAAAASSAPAASSETGSPNGTPTTRASTSPTAGPDVQSFNPPHVPAPIPEKPSTSIPMSRPPPPERVISEWCRGDFRTTFASLGDVELCDAPMFDVSANRPPASSPAVPVTRVYLACATTGHMREHYLHKKCGFTLSTATQPAGGADAASPHRVYGGTKELHGVHYNYKKYGIAITDAEEIATKRLVPLAGGAAGASEGSVGGATGTAPSTTVDQQGSAASRGPAAFIREFLARRFGKNSEATAVVPAVRAIRERPGSGEPHWPSSVVSAGPRQVVAGNRVGVTVHIKDREGRQVVDRPLPTIHYVALTKVTAAASSSHSAVVASAAAATQSDAASAAQLGATSVALITRVAGALVVGAVARGHLIVSNTVSVRPTSAFSDSLSAICVTPSTCTAGSDMTISVTLRDTQGNLSLPHSVNDMILRVACSDVDIPVTPLALCADGTYRSSCVPTVAGDITVTLVIGAMSIAYRGPDLICVSSDADFKNSHLAFDELEVIAGDEVHGNFLVRDSFGNRVARMDQSAFRLELFNGERQELHSTEIYHGEYAFDFRPMRTGYATVKATCLATTSGGGGGHGGGAAAPFLVARVQVVAGRDLSWKDSVASSTSSSIFAGETVTVHVITKDAYGNAVIGADTEDLLVTARYSDDSHVSCDIGDVHRVEASGGTTFRFDATPTRAGTLLFDVAWRGELHPQPVAVEVQPAMLCWESSTLLTPMSTTAGVTCSVTIDCRDRYRNPTPATGSDFIAWVTNEGAVAPTRSVEGYGSQFTFSFVATKRGSAKVFVSYTGHDAHTATVAVLPAPIDWSASSLKLLTPRISAGDEPVRMSVHFRDEFGNDTPACELSDLEVRAVNEGRILSVSRMAAAESSTIRVVDNVHDAAGGASSSARSLLAETNAVDVHTAIPASTVEPLLLDPCAMVLVFWPTVKGLASAEVTYAPQRNVMAPAANSEAIVNSQVSAPISAIPKSTGSVRVDSSVICWSASIFSIVSTAAAGGGQTTTTTTSVSAALGGRVIAGNSVKAQLVLLDRFGNPSTALVPRGFAQPTFGASLTVPRRTSSTLSAEGRGSGAHSGSDPALDNHNNSSVTGTPLVPEPSVFPASFRAVTDVAPCLLGRRSPTEKQVQRSPVSRDGADEEIVPLTSTRRVVGQLHVIEVCCTPVHIGTLRLEATLTDSARTCLDQHLLLRRLANLEGDKTCVVAEDSEAALDTVKRTADLVRPAELDWQEPHTRVIAPGKVQAGETFTIVVRLRDAFDNPVSLSQATIDVATQADITSSSHAAARHRGGPADGAGAAAAAGSDRVLSSNDSGVSPLHDGAAQGSAWLPDSGLPPFLALLSHESAARSFVVQSDVTTASASTTTAGHPRIIHPDEMGSKSNPPPPPEGVFDIAAFTSSWSHRDLNEDATSTLTFRLRCVVAGVLSVSLVAGTMGARHSRVQITVTAAEAQWPQTSIAWLTGARRSSSVPPITLSDPPAVASDTRDHTQGTDAANVVGHAELDAITFPAPSPWRPASCESVAGHDTVFLVEFRDRFGNLTLLGAPSFAERLHAELLSGEQQPNPTAISGAPGAEPLVDPLAVLESFDHQVEPGILGGLLIAPPSTDTTREAENADEDDSCRTTTTTRLPERPPTVRAFRCNRTRVGRYHVTLSLRGAQEGEGRAPPPPSDKDADNLAASHLSRELSFANDVAYGPGPLSWQHCTLELDESCVAGDAPGRCLLSIYDRFMNPSPIAGQFEPAEVVAVARCVRSVAVREWHGDGAGGVAVSHDAFQAHSFHDDDTTAGNAVTSLSEIPVCRASFTMLGGAPTSALAEPQSFSHQLRGTFAPEIVGTYRLSVECPVTIAGGAPLTRDIEVHPADVQWDSRRCRVQVDAERFGAADSVVFTVTLRDRFGNKSSRGVQPYADCFEFRLFRSVAMTPQRLVLHYNAASSGGGAVGVSTAALVSQSTVGMHQPSPQRQQRETLSIDETDYERVVAGTDYRIQGSGIVASPEVGTWRVTCEPLVSGQYIAKVALCRRREVGTEGEMMNERRSDVSAVALAKEITVDRPCIVWPAEPCWPRCSLVPLTKQVDEMMPLSPPPVDDTTQPVTTEATAGDAEGALFELVLRDAYDNVCFVRPELEYFSLVRLSATLLEKTTPLSNLSALDAARDCTATIYLPGASSDEVDHNDDDDTDSLDEALPVDAAPAPRRSSAPPKAVVTEHHKKCGPAAPRRDYGISLFPLSSRVFVRCVSARVGDAVVTAAHLEHGSVEPYSVPARFLVAHVGASRAVLLDIAGSDGGAALSNSSSFRMSAGSAIPLGFLLRDAHGNAFSWSDLSHHRDKTEKGSLSESPLIAQATFVARPVGPPLTREEREQIPITTLRIAEDRAAAAKLDATGKLAVYRPDKATTLDRAGRWHVALHARMSSDHSLPPAVLGEAEVVVDCGPVAARGSLLLLRGAAATSSAQPMAVPESLLPSPSTGAEAAAEGNCAAAASASPPSLARSAAGAPLVAGDTILFDALLNDAFGNRVPLLPSRATVSAMCGTSPTPVTIAARRYAHQVNNAQSVSSGSIALEERNASAGSASSSPPSSHRPNAVGQASLVVDLPHDVTVVFQCMPIEAGDLVITLVCPTTDPEGEERSASSGNAASSAEPDDIASVVGSPQQVVTSRPCPIGFAPVDWASSVIRIVDQQSIKLGNDSSVMITLKDRFGNTVSGGNPEDFRVTCTCNGVEMTLPLEVARAGPKAFMAFFKPGQRGLVFCDVAYRGDDAQRRQSNVVRVE